MLLATQLQVVICPSRLLLAGLLVLAGAALFSLAIVPVPIYLRGSVAVGVISIAAISVGRVLLKFHSSIRAIELLKGGMCLLTDTSGAEIYASIRPDSVAWSWILLLWFSKEGARESIVVPVLRDSLSEADWRRLSIWLRWQASGSHA